LKCPECVKKQHEQVKDTPQLPGFAPIQCDDDGTFQEHQTNDGGFSWCVDKETGEEVNGTKGQGIANCKEKTNTALNVIRARDKCTAACTSSCNQAFQEEFATGAPDVTAPDVSPPAGNVTEAVPQDAQTRPPNPDADKCEHACHSVCKSTF